MILDNENKNLKVHEWIAKYNEEGVLDIVTGYFTIGALAFLSNVTHDRIHEYRFVLGDIVKFNDNRDRALDLLNENICVEANLGDGLMKIEGYEAGEIPVILPSYLPEREVNNFENRNLSDIFTELGFDKTQPIREQEPNPLPDRKESDDIVFDDGANRSRAKRGLLGNGRISQATIG